ncbi:hypothetical protein QMJ91_10580 [Acinetobacter baumannii]|uniref:Uncharacterized protein n=1 Tax=Acinetobacter baumannii 21072 TaxID=1310697 RepID=A0A062IU46_ACIBA|nr:MULTISPECIES: hypothetical protein [Acinetobacter calcoaceticus/baumannii complex]EXB45067.1 hypothetical protein J540_3019 [Acinetobacter baumannii 1440422]EHZ7613193.1 hypothetical protein [Acinetobacter baumannii]EHZ8840039.1 hypothetical protein [Acinetobacter baumannii]EJB8489112.1 hypothetical protein [Acinetobacter baumannii]EJX0975028.1 hypothetical protein [Acinetobacter baumannii]
MLSKAKKLHRQKALRPSTEQWEIIATIGFAIILTVIGYFCIGGAKANAAVVARAASVSSARPSTSFARSYSSSSTHAPTTTSFRSSPVKTVTKPSTIRSVKPVTTPAKPMPVSSSSTQKKSRKIGFQYDYYAFTDCIPYSSGSFQGWKCIDRD